MKTASIIVGIAFALAPLGCHRSAEGGTAKADDAFTIAAESPPHPIKQGDSESVKVTVNRGKNFHESIRFEAKAPEKIHVSVDRELVKETGSQDVNVRIHPNEEAPPGEYKVVVTANSNGVAPAHVELTVTVVKK